MKPDAVTDAAKTAETGERPEKGHDAWARRKIARGLVEAADREQLIPADKVWRDLGLER
jgi:hypothetical protein